MVQTATNQQIDDFLSLFDSPLDGVRTVVAYLRHSRHSQPPQASASLKPIIISFEHVTKSYKVGKQQIKALDDVSLKIREGEIVAITGKSGSGKSTLLQMIGCLDKPNKGDILIDSRDPRRLSDSKLSDLRQKTVGFVFQSFYLQPFLKLDQNVAVPAMFARTPLKEIDTSVTELLDRVGISAERQHLPKELSGGQIQRAAIARALVNRPKIILADEPTGNLDSTNGRAIIELFKQIRLKLGTTIIIVTHDESIARQADRVIRLVDGAIE